MHTSQSHDRGFSLLETLVAIGLLVGGVVSLAHLLVLASTINADAKAHSIAATLAAQKIEELQSLSAWAPGGDFLDAEGGWLGSGGDPPPGTAYIRTWTVEALPADPVNGLIAQVAVRPAGGARGPDVRFVAVRPEMSP